MDNPKVIEDLVDLANLESATHYLKEETDLVSMFKAKSFCDETLEEIENIHK